MRRGQIVLSSVEQALDGSYHALTFCKYAIVTALMLSGDSTTASASMRWCLDAMVPRWFVASARCNPWPERKLRDAPAFAG